MSAATIIPPGPDEFLRRKRFSRSEVQRMTDAGFFAGQRLELIEGDLIDKMGQNPPHASAIRRLNEWLTLAFGARRVYAQLPLEVAPKDRDRSLPEPDLTVLAERKPEYDFRHPRGNETLLVVEVADTSLRQDLTVKRDLYARAEAPEYWVLDIVRRELHVHRKPSGGKYLDVTRLTGDSLASPESLSGVEIRVEDLLPRQPAE